MGTLGKRWGVGWRLGALVLIASIGLVCVKSHEGDDDDTTSDPLQVQLLEPNVNTFVPVDAEIVIRLSRPCLGPVDVNCVEVWRSDDSTLHETSTVLEDLSMQLRVTHTLDFEEGTNYDIILRHDLIIPAAGDPMSDDESWSFTTEGGDPGPPTFSTPELVVGLDGFSSGIDLAASRDGDGIAVFWYEELDSASPTMWQHIYASAIRQCQAGDPVLLLFDAGDRGQPVVAANEAGHAIAAGPYWDRVDEDTGHGIWIRHFGPDTGWSEATFPPIPTHADPVQSVDVGIDADGNGIISYLAPPTGAIPNYHVEYTLYDEAGDAWSTPVPYDAGGDVSEPRLAMNDAGKAIVVAVEDEDGGGVRYYCPAGGDGRAAPAPGWTASQARVDMSADGMAFVIWREENAAQTESRIRVARVTACGAAKIQYVDNGTGHVVSHPHIAVGPGSVAAASWVHHRPTPDYALVVNHYTPLGGWDADPEPVLTSNLIIWGTHVAISSTGQVTVLGFTSQAAEVSTLLSSGAWSEPQDVSTVENPISLQLVDYAKQVYVAEDKLVVGFLTNIGGLQDAGLTLCD